MIKKIERKKIVDTSLIYIVERINQSNSIEFPRKMYFRCARMAKKEEKSCRLNTHSPQKTFPSKTMRKENTKKHEEREKT